MFSKAYAYPSVSKLGRMMQAKMIGDAWSREHYVEKATRVRNNERLCKGEKARLVLPC
jgi:hypothetical protein